MLVEGVRGSGKQVISVERQQARGEWCSARGRDVKHVVASTTYRLSSVLDHDLSFGSLTGSGSSSHIIRQSTGSGS